MWTALRWYARPPEMVRAGAVLPGWSGPRALCGLLGLYGLLTLLSLPDWLVQALGALVGGAVTLGYGGRMVVEHGTRAGGRVQGADSGGQGDAAVGRDSLGVRTRGLDDYQHGTGSGRVLDGVHSNQQRDIRVDAHTAPARESTPARTQRRSSRTRRSLGRRRTGPHKLKERA